MCGELGLVWYVACCGLHAVSAEQQPLTLTRIAHWSATRLTLPAQAKQVARWEICMQLPLQLPLQLQACQIMLHRHSRQLNLHLRLHHHQQKRHQLMR